MSVNFRRAARAADRALTNLDPNRDLIGPDVAPKWHYEDRWSPRMKIEDRRGKQIEGRSAAARASRLSLTSFILNSLTEQIKATIVVDERDDELLAGPALVTAYHNPSAAEAGRNGLLRRKAGQSVKLPSVASRMIKLIRQKWLI
jgi:hypothetical protein